MRLGYSELGGYHNLPEEKVFSFELFFVKRSAGLDCVEKYDAVFDGIAY